MWHAWVDESQPGSPGGPAAYVVAAVVCEPAEIGEARAEMKSLLLRSQRKLHWRDESEPRRRKIIEAVAALECLEHIVVIRDDKPGEQPERRRRHCLERLFYELDVAGVSHVFLESRAPKQNKLDADLLNRLRAKKVVGAQLRIDHEPGPTDEALWIADVVCGAAGAFHVAGTDVYWQALAPRATLHRV